MERVRRRWWTVLVTGAASLVVFGALLTAGFQLVMLLAPGYREDIAAYVGRTAGQPVDIGGVSLGWNGLSPRLDLTDITLYDPDGETPALSADRLAVGFSLLRLAGGNTMPERIELSGLELVAQVGKDGRVTVRGLDTAGGPSRAKADWLRHIGRFERIRLRNCEVQLEDPRLKGPAPRFRLAQAKVSFKDGHGKATAQLALPVNMGSMIEFDAAIDGNLEKVESWAGQWSATVDGLVGLPWLDALLAQDAAVGFRDTTLRLSGEIARGRPGTVKAELNAGAIVGRRGRTETALRDVRVLANLRPEGRGWLADIERLAVTGANGQWPVTHARVRWQGGDAPAVDAAAEYLDLRDVAAWAPLIAFRGLDQEAARLKRLSGSVRRLVVNWSGAGTGPRFSLRADLASLGLAESPTIPGFAGISGEFSATENQGRLALREAPFTLRYPKVFPHEAVFEKVSGEIAWVRGAEGWQVRMPRFGWELEGSRGEGDFELFIPGGGEGSPRLRLDARFSAADVTRLKGFMPLHWGEGLRRWLDRAVLAGRAPSARLRIAGDLADFPFEEKPGTFALDLDLADGKLAFAPDWPPLEGLAARLEFRGDGLSVTAEGGTIGGNRVEHAQAMIPSYRAGQLTVSAEAQGDAARFYDVLRASPLASHLAGLLGRTSASGESTVLLNLDIPLHDVRGIQVDGTARLAGAELAVPGLSEPIRDIRGDLQFTTRGVTADQLTGSLYDTPLTASITRDADGLNRLTGQFSFAPDADGAGLTRLLPAFLHARLIGTSAWQAQLDLNGMDANHLRLSSDLRGLQVKLPQPME
ncbi:MAG TPA: DUF3971 domain-containing protein, partial [Nevskiaceae bacterium]|nr:DUF3971 domain-containing protein [Nevskiaceae bacterium]